MDGQSETNISPNDFDVRGMNYIMAGRAFVVAKEFFIMETVYM